MILSIDPSGSFKEGKGQSGWVIMEDGKLKSFGLIKATDYDSRTSFWKAHSDLITENFNLGMVVVIENFRLYSNKATSQINSELETARLLGHLEYFIEKEMKGVTLHYQMATQVKNRFKDEILLKENLITKDSNGRYYLNGINVAGHVIDALRHACFYNLTERIR